MKAFVARWKIPIIVGAIALVALVGITLQYGYLVTGPKTVIVTRTATGFVPNTLTLRKGDSITFVSTTGKEFWPASNFHPSHGLYPEFDPKRQLEPSERWTFTFTKVGTWGFHDHLESGIKGTIRVEGSPFDIGGECSGKADIDTATVSAPCWQSKITTLMQKKGYVAAFDYLNTLHATNASFRNSCHDTMHFVGAMAYQQFQSTHTLIARPETTYCGYGFYHGFIEAMQIASGPGNFDEVRTYCESVRGAMGEAASGPCFHGLGHALFDSVSGTLWGDPKAMMADGLASCEKALANTTVDDRARCASGVYNSYANAATNQNYNLTRDIINPTQYCNTQRPEYRMECYAQIGISYIRYKRFNREQTITYLRSLDTEASLRGFFDYFADEAKRNINGFDVNLFSKVCMAFTPTEQFACVRGVVEGLLEQSPSDSAYVVQFNFCSVLPDSDLRKRCYSQAIETTLSSVRTSAPFRTACNALPEINHAGLCM